MVDIPLTQLCYTPICQSGITMGRFLSNKPYPVTPAFVTAGVSISPPPQVSSPKAQPTLALPEEQASVFQRLGFYAYCGVAVSTTANDLMLRLTGQKAYIYWIAFPVAIILLVTCGTMFRGLRLGIGKMWLGLAAWMLICVPTSFWPGGSVQLLELYLPRVHILFFLIVAFVITRRQCQQMMAFNVFLAILMLIICITFGGTVDDTGRLCIQNSILFSNPNDLAIQLLAGMGSLTYLLFSQNRIKIGFGVAGLALSVLFVLKTGSRGALLAAGVLLVTAFFVTNAKAPIFMAGILALLLLPFVSSSVFHRLTLVLLNPSAATVTTQEDSGNVASQVQRQYLIRRSLELTLTHPLFGVGAGEFVDASSGADAKVGIHSAALGTHNSYMEISSENGLPGLFLYAGALFLSTRLMIKLYKVTTNRPDLRDFMAMSYSAWVSLLGFALSSGFHHLGYSGYVATLCGTAVVIHMAAQPYLRKA